jgi:tetratricopeptide (TPR) repeat protein
MKSMAYSALGAIEMTKKNWPAAEQNLQKATEISAAEPDAATYLRLAMARGEQKKYPEALDAANKAVQYAPAGSQVANLAKAEHDRLQQMMAGSGGAAGTGAAGSTSAPATAPATAPPAASGTQSPQAAPTPQ